MHRLDTMKRTLRKRDEAAGDEPAVDGLETVSMGVDGMIHILGVPELHLSILNTAAFTNGRRELERSESPPSRVQARLTGVRLLLRVCSEAALACL